MIIFWSPQTFRTTQGLGDGLEFETRQPVTNV